MHTTGRNGTSCRCLVKSQILADKSVTPFKLVDLFSSGSCTGDTGDKGHIAKDFCSLNNNLLSSEPSEIASAGCLSNLLGGVLGIVFN